MNYEDIVKVNKLFTEAKVPTKDRYGYMVMDDGSIKMFGPTTDTFVKTGMNKNQTNRFYKVK